GPGRSRGHLRPGVPPRSPEPDARNSHPARQDHVRRDPPQRGGAQVTDTTPPRGARSAPGGVTSGDDTTEGTDIASGAMHVAPAVHPGVQVTGNSNETEPVSPTGDLPENAVLRGLVEAFED